MKYVALSVIAGGLLGSTSLFSHAWVLFLIAIPLFFYCMDRAPTYTRVLWCGFVFGLVKSMLALWWFWDTLPLTWLGISFKNQILVLGFHWFTASIVLGLGFVLFASMWYLLRYRLVYLRLFVPLVWVLSEVTGSVVFSIYTLGPGSTINTSFSFGYVGYALAEHLAFLQVATYGGVYLLSAIGVTCALCVYQLLRYTAIAPRYRCSVSILVVSFIFLTSYWYVPAPKAQSGQRVIGINTAFNADELQASGSTQKKRDSENEAVTRALTHNPDAIVLPEDARLTNGTTSSDESWRIYHELAGDSSTILIDSARTEDEEGNTVLRAYIYNPNEQEVVELDKQYLLPLGEYLMYVTSWLGRVGGSEAFVSQYESDMNYQAGKKVATNETPPWVPGMLFCSESVVPMQARYMTVNRDVPFIAHPTSHAWFQKRTRIQLQLKRMLRVQAVWSNTNIIVASNMGESGLYRYNGVVDAGVELERGDTWRMMVYEF